MLTPPAAVRVCVAAEAFDLRRGAAMRSLIRERPEPWLSRARTLGRATARQPSGEGSQGVLQLAGSFSAARSATGQVVVS